MLKLDSYSSAQYLYSLDSSGRVTGKKSNFTKLQEAKTSSFRDTLTLSAAQESGSEVRSMGVADLSVRQSFYSTGDPEQDRQIALGLEYKRSCFDFTHAKEFDEITAKQKEAGFDDLSRTEKYAAIYKKYQYCYGENFLDAKAIEYVDPPLSEDGCMSIIKKFNNEVADVCGGGGKTAKVRKAALYGDMSDYEVRQAILQKYSKNGEMSQRDLFRAANEMDLCGVGGGIRDSLNPIGNPFIYKDPLGTESTAEVREKMLDTPVTSSFLNDIEKVYKNRIMVGGYVDGDFFRVLGQIMSSIK